MSVNYPPEAYAENGQLWWELQTWPGTKQRFGAEVKLAAWLAFNAKVGDIFTIRQLRSALSENEGPNPAEHFNRRWRALRDFGWKIVSARDVSDLRPDEYRLASRGSPIWLGKSKFRKSNISAKLRRLVLDRDGHRCVVCGIGAGEPYPGEPGTQARLTIGHVVAGALSGRSDVSNLRTECARCNEPARETAVRSQSAGEIWPRIRDLKRAEKARLLRWIQRGYRERDAVDELYDLYRALPSAQRDEIKSKLQDAVKGISADLESLDDPATK